MVYKKMKSSAILRGTLWMLMAHGGRLFIQMAYFVLLSWKLGVTGLGVFSGVVAAFNVISPFSGWGSGSLLVMNVARDVTSFSRNWAKTLKIVLVSSTILVGAGTITGTYLFSGKGAWTVVLCIALADLVFARLLDVSAQAFQAFDKLNYTGTLQLFGQTVRLLAAGAFATLGYHSVEQWGWFYLSASVVSAITGLVMVRVKLGSPGFSAQVTRQDVHEGFHFSLALAAKSIYSDVDKTILLKMGTETAAGLYAAAYKVINIAIAPTQALLSASYSHFFRAGQSGARATLGMARRFVWVVTGYGALAGIFLFAVAPLMSWILGPEYAATVSVLRLLALVPLIQGVHYVAADALTGAGFQRHRSAIQVAAGILNILLNLVLIPHYSWRGAAWATLATEAILGLSLWICLLKNSRSVRDVNLNHELQG